MSTPNRPSAPSTIRRAALYLRVSTGRQAAGEVSIPSQRELTRRFCETQDWVVTEEYVEPGASATDDRRPVFQRMLEDARHPERRFDVICVHAFSRFYRNGAEMELTIRRLRKLGVEVVSVTQPTGDDPSQALMRQIIGIFDEYTSRENGKNVTRSMLESARQGFWNGATSPLGYRIVEAERRGSKIKKRLAIDAVEAEIVRLIYTLYTAGDGTTRPLGVKEVAKWLNSRGYRTRRGSPFGVGPLHTILTNRFYATGKWSYGVRNSKTGQPNDPSSVVEIDIPTLLPMDLFERVQAKLKQNNPRVTPPRIVNGPILLTGLVVCASCGAGMTRTGTSGRRRRYNYYSCGGCHRQGATTCQGRHVPMEKLDELIIENVKERLLVPERMASLLEALVARRHRRKSEVAVREQALHEQLAQAKDKLARLYRAIEDGVVDLDADLKIRIDALKTERDIAQASLDRIASQTGAAAELTPARIAAFAELMREKLDSGDVQARKAYLRTVLSRIEVGDQRIRLIGERAALADAITGRTVPGGPVRGFVQKWRARRDSNSRPSGSKPDALSN